MELDQIIENEYQNVAGMVILKGGEVVHERYYNGFGPGDAVHVASVTKSVFSALVGIALELGQLKSVEQRVLDFFPEYSAGDETAKRVTIRDMLTMTAPYRYEQEPFLDFFSSEHWLEFALGQLGGGGKIGDFLYAGIIGTHILSGVLARATGWSVFDFAAEHLFGPLGIDPGEHVVLHSEAEQTAFFQDKCPKGWVADGQGLNPAGWGLTLTAMDMAKLGQLYLGGGAWEGRQVVPAAWVAESTREHSRWGELRYGYLWWLARLNGLEAFCAMGDGGNTICCVPERELVVAVASTFVPEAKDRLEMIERYILKGV